MPRLRRLAPHITGPAFWGQFCESQICSVGGRGVPAGPATLLLLSFCMPSETRKDWVALAGDVATNTARETDTDFR